jgi:hypothetical protein
MEDQMSNSRKVWRNSIFNNNKQLFEKRTGCAPNHEVNIKWNKLIKSKKIPPQFIPLKLLEGTKTKLDKWVADGIARKVTNSEFITWISSLYPIEKHNSTTIGPVQADDIRLTINCKSVNEAIIDDTAILLPDMQQVKYDLNNAKIFTKIDIRDAYSTLKLDEETSNLFTFSTPWGLYKLLRLIQGVKVSPAKFQEYMNSQFGDIKCVKCCIDDFLIYGKADPDKMGTSEETANAYKNHDEAVAEVLNRCKALNLTLNEKKCQFGVESTTYYGQAISTKGFQPLQTKMNSFKNVQRTSLSYAVF